MATGFNLFTVTRRFWFSVTDCLPQNLICYHANKLNYIKNHGNVHDLSEVRYTNAVYHTKFISISPRFFLIKRLGGKRKISNTQLISFLPSVSAKYTEEKYRLKSLSFYDIHGPMDKCYELFPQLSNLK